MSKLVLVTGATGGIGSCVVRLLSKKNFVPVIGHRAAKTADAEALAEECGGLTIPLDMDIQTTIAAGVERLAHDVRPIAGVVLAASPPPKIAPFGQISLADHTLFWTANVVGPQQLLAGLVRHCFRRQKTGTVVAVLSKAMNTSDFTDAEGPTAMSSMGAYTISKFGLQGVMAQLRADYPWLTVASVKPGFTETSMLAVFDDRFVKQLREQRLLSRPEDIASEIVEQFIRQQK